MELLKFTKCEIRKLRNRPGQKISSYNWVFYQCRKPLQQNRLSKDETRLSRIETIKKNMGKFVTNLGSKSESFCKWRAKSTEVDTWAGAGGGWRLTEVLAGPRRGDRFGEEGSSAMADTRESWLREWGNEAKNQVVVFDGERRRLILGGSVATVITTRCGEIGRWYGYEEDGVDRTPLPFFWDWNPNLP